MTAPDSAGTDGAEPLAARLSTALERFRRRGERVRTHLDRALDGSRVAGQLRRWPRIAATSTVGRWLTQEPDPTVVVIDLRETRTIGPILAVLEWLPTAMSRTPGTHGSRFPGAVREQLERHAPAVAGGAVFGVVAGRLLGRGLPADPLPVLELVVLAVAGVLCLAAERVRIAAEHSTAVSWLGEFLQPPDVDDA